MLLCAFYVNEMRANVGGLHTILLDKTDVTAGGFKIADAAEKVFAPLNPEDPEREAKIFFDAVNKRFRLAGFRFNIKNRNNAGAIIEDRNDGVQWIRKKGEALTENVTVAGVGTNSVILATPYGSYELLRSKKNKNSTVSEGRELGDTGAAVNGQMSPALSGISSGQTTPGTWHLKRSDVMDYFNEIRDRPERIEAVFDTLAPVWYTDEADGKQKIEGYRVEICGEEDFFRAVGFNEGDIVREVNGIRMTNRYAAEELIRRFIHDDLEFAHIRMERNGEDIIQSYLLEK